MRITNLIYTLVMMGFPFGCQTAYHAPHTVMIERVNDPLAELEDAVGSDFVDKIRKNTQALGHTTSYQHCIRHISPEKYAQLQKAMLDKGDHGIVGITPVETCPVAATAQCVKVSTSDYYYGTSEQMLQELKAQCQTEGTWFSTSSKRWANASVL